MGFRIWAMALRHLVDKLGLQRHVDMLGLSLGVALAQQFAGGG
jgi:hypothetical protein